MIEQPFWKTKILTEMTTPEWESLCDGCARCCLEKLEDDETGEVHYTNLSCRHLDQEKCRCTDYQHRSVLVPHCIWLKPEQAAEFKWLPNTCAYRLIAEGKDLYDWHPLVSGSADTVHEAGISVRGKCISEEFVHPEQWEEHLIKWVEQ